MHAIKMDKNFSFQTVNQQFNFRILDDIGTDIVTAVVDDKLYSSTQFSELLVSLMGYNIDLVSS